MLSLLHYITLERELKDYIANQSQLLRLASDRLVERERERERERSEIREIEESRCKKYSNYRNGRICV